MRRQRIQKAWGRMAHRGWVRLILDLDRTRDLIIQGPALRSVNGAAIPDYFFFNHPLRGGFFAT